MIVNRHKYLSLHQLPSMHTKKPLLIILALLMSIPSHAAEQLFSTQDSVTPELAHPGKYRVGVQTISVVNPKQLSTVDFSSIADRPLTLEVWYPSSKIEKKQSESTKASYQDQTRSGKSFSLQGQAYRNLELDASLAPAPLIILSHGYTGYRSMMFYLGEHLASHGYIVASIDHTDSTNKEINFNQDAGAGFASTLYNRARDQQFALDYLSSTNSQFSSLLSTTSAAIIGFSMGGYGALNTIGGCYNFSSAFLKEMGFPKNAVANIAETLNNCSAGRTSVDPRWKAMVSFAPWGGEQGIHKPSSLANIKLPTMLVGGDQDDVSGFEDGVAKLFRQIGSKDKYLMVYENARHNIAAHPAPKVAFDNDLDIGHYYEPSWNSETITRINKHMVLAFLNHHVRRDKVAKTYLPKRELATQTKDENGKLNAPWPGFPDRWAVGIRFVRGE